MFFVLIMSAPTHMSSLLASLSSTSVAADAPWNGKFCGGTSSLGAGDLSSPLTPSVIAAPAVGVVTFKAGDNRCRGIVGSSKCAWAVIGCDVVLN